MTLYLDYETRAVAPLRDVGVYRYVACPLFRILMCGWSVDGGPVQVAVGDAQLRAIPGLLDPTVEHVAHNAQFERLVTATLDPAMADPRCWTDTAALAAEYGYPASLDRAARAVGAAPKDPAGGQLIKLFTEPNRKGGWNDESTHPSEWGKFVAYCAQDVRTLIDLRARLRGWPTLMEREVWRADQAVNDRGLRIDVELCQAAVTALDRNRALARREFTALTGVDNPDSVVQVLRWAQGAGLPLVDLRVASVARVMADPDLDPVHRRVMELRSELALAAGGKFGAALKGACDDGRVRGGFRFFGAHTGRWTGQRVQPQNLPRAVVADPEAAILDLKMGLGASSHTLKALVRSMFLGPYCVVDYSAIEARVVAWLAGESWALQAFRDGRDIYVETAERMGGLTRFQGKVAVLALGYNGGVNSLRVMGAQGSDEELRSMVSVWRRANTNIVKLWAAMDDAVELGGPVGPYLHLVRHGSSLEMKLPSGRSVWYHDVRWERHRVEHGPSRESWRYADPKRGGARIATYGGRLVENATQAVARDVLAEALVRLEHAGVRVVGHVHDEVIAEDDRLPLVRNLMTQSPRWAAGLPLDAEGYTAFRYRKA